MSSAQWVIGLAAVGVLVGCGGLGKTSPDCRPCSSDTACPAAEQCRRGHCVGPDSDPARCLGSSGGTAPDSGSPSADAGPRDADGGHPMGDAGGDLDAGNVLTDAGSTASDGGASGSDGGPLTCSPAAIFCDDFTAASPPAPYAVTGGAWVRSSGAFTASDGAPWARDAALLSGSAGDFDVELVAQSRGDTGLGLVYAAQSATQGYAVLVHPAQFQGIYLKRLNGGASDTPLASVPLAFDMTGQVFTLRVQRQGSTVTVTFNGQQVIVADDGSNGAAGALGLLLSNTDNVTGGAAVFHFFELSSATAPAPDAGGSSTDAGSSIDAGGNSTDAGGGTGTPVPLGVPGTWTLAFDDEFDGTALDASKWDPNWYGEGGTMNNVATYASNVSVSGGYARLVLSSSNAGALIHTGYQAGRYTLPVGGYAEARVLFPGGGSSGPDIYNWPAWWASGPSWPAAGEHDIAEGLSGQLTVNYHSPSGPHNQGAPPGAWGSAFHVYGVFRGPGYADVYWDGVKVESYPTDDDGQPQELIVNVGAGGTEMLGAAGAVLVDYVRAWR